MTTNLSRDEIASLAFEIIIKTALLAVILYYAFSIVKPFIVLVLWGIIIAVTLSPVIDKMNHIVKAKRTLIIIAFTVLLVAVLLVPTYMLSDSVISSSQDLVHNLKEGTLVFPSPTENVKDWPIVGEKFYTLWSSATSDLENTLVKIQPTIEKYLPSIASAISGALIGVLQFIVSLIVAAVFLVNSERSVKIYHAISRRLVGEKGIEWAKLSALTIRSVVQGVIGIAIIQAVLSFIGLVLIGMPLAWLWAFVVLFLAIIQLPLIIILGPIIAYVFSYADSTPATIFAVYAFIVSVVDGFLKPIFLGRGIDIPMLVILLGAIGGMILFGILGLFVGSVGLALAYKIFMVWLEDETQQ